MGGAGEVLGDLFRLDDGPALVVHVENNAIRLAESLQITAVALEFCCYMVKPCSSLKVAKTGNDPATRIESIAFVATGWGAKKSKHHW